MPERHCPECGQSWGDEATFCGGCGARLPGRPVGRAARAEHALGTGRRSRWLAAAMVAIIMILGAGATALTRGSVSDEAAPADDEVAIPEGDDLQDPDGQQVDHGPQITCERDGEPVDCVDWRRRLVSDASAPDLHSWWVDVAPDWVLAADAETLVALSRTSGQVAWRKGFDLDDRLVGGPPVVGDGVVAVQTGRTVRALSLATGTEAWSVDDARLQFQFRPSHTRSMFTIDDDGGWTRLAAREPDGTVRWRHRVAETDSAGRGSTVDVTEVGPVTFLVSDGRELHTTALDSKDGTKGWRRADSRPIHAAAGVAVMVDVDREVREDDDTLSISEATAAMVGVDLASGAQQWRRDDAGADSRLAVVDDVIVAVTADGLTGIDAVTGRDLWQGDLAEELPVSTAAPWGPSVSQQRRVVTFVPHDRRVVARDPATGEILWQTHVEQLVTNVSVMDDAILATQSGSRSLGGDRMDTITVVQLDPATGDVRGTITAQSDGRPQLLARDVLVDPETGWAVRVDLSGT